MGGFFAGIVTWLLGKLFGKPGAQPAPVVEGEKLGASQTNLAGVEQENEQLKAAAVAGNAAAVSSVRNDPASGSVHTAPADPINNLPGETFRD